MFVKSIDNKNTYTDKNGLDVVDIGESFINPDGQAISMYGIYKVPKEMEMRPDKVSISAYGSDLYTEMVCVFNNIKNPFTIEENDIVNIVSLNNIYDNTYEPVSEVIANNKNNGYEMFRDFIDKSRYPKTVGSEKNRTTVGKSTDYIGTSTSKNLMSTNNILDGLSGSGTVKTVSTLPPNVARSNSAALEYKDGRIIYGANNDNYNAVDSNTANKVVSDSTQKLTDTNNISDALSSKFKINNPYRAGQAPTVSYADNMSSLVDSLLNPDNTYTDVNSSNTNGILDNTSAYNANTDLNNGIGGDTGSADDSVTSVNNLMKFGKNSDVGCAVDNISLGDFKTDQIKNKIKR